MNLSFYEILFDDDIFKKMQKEEVLNFLSVLS